MSGELNEITLGESKPLEGITTQSFNNDSKDDAIRNSFSNMVPSFRFNSVYENKVPSKYRLSNVHYYDSKEIYISDDKIVVGQYCDEGVVVPRTFSIAFNQLYNCSPLISLIKGDEEFISFLHVWAEYHNREIVDRQVKHWMETVSKYGEISETIFAPRTGGFNRTSYKTAIDDITKISQKTIVLKRELSEIIGIASGEGVYFNECGYHLWEQ
jgi:hypothetical protein